MEQNTNGILKIIKEWSEAELNGNTEILGKLLNYDFIGVGPLGFKLNKKQWLDRHSGGTLKYSTFIVDDIDVRIYPTSAVAIGRNKTEGTYNGEAIAGEFRISLFFIVHQNEWLIAGQHLSQIGQPSMLKH